MLNCSATRIFFANQQELVAIPPISVPHGKIHTVCGPSGSGKSTFFAYVAGFLPSDFVVQGGEVFVESERVDTLPVVLRKIGLVWQEAMLFPHMNVYQNCNFALPQRFRGAERQEKIFTTLRDIGLAELAYLYPSQISGGQAHRIAVVRALLAEPRAILLDEPFASLDTKNKQVFRVFVWEYLARAKVPALLVTHDHNDIPDVNQVTYIG